MPKAMPYYVRIARFMPRVEIVQRYHSTVRRLYIQGDNGKASCQYIVCMYVCSYLVEYGFAMSEMHALL